MELKYFYRNEQWEDSKVLIVPLWNWNLVIDEKTYNNLSFNCTFMELKSSSSSKASWTQQVLIVPLWNWNYGFYKNHKQLYQVLIVPLWNWNSEDREGKKTVETVLIVPLWNWNWIILLFLHLLARFNCTFMELK